MDITQWMLFIIVGLAATISPGPAILLAISNSVRFGLAKVMLSTLGNITGLLILSIAAIFGLGAVLKTSSTLFLIVKILGAAYLVYLGVRQWRSRDNFFAGGTNVDDKTSPSYRSARETKRNLQIFTEGFLIAITNPKAILFFTALFPQFINTDESLTKQFLIMTFTFMSISFVSLMGYGFLASRAKSWFSKGSRTQWFNRIFGGVFITIGVGVLGLKLEQ